MISSYLVEYCALGGEANLMDAVGVGAYARAYVRETSQVEWHAHSGARRRHRAGAKASLRAAAAVLLPGNAQLAAAVFADGNR